MSQIPKFVAVTRRSINVFVLGWESMGSPKLPGLQRLNSSCPEIPLQQSPGRTCLGFSVCRGALDTRISRHTFIREEPWISLLAKAHLEIPVWDSPLQTGKTPGFPAYRGTPRESPGMPLQAEKLQGFPLCKGAPRVLSHRIMPLKPQAWQGPTTAEQQAMSVCNRKCKILQILVIPLHF